MLIITLGLFFHFDRINCDEIEKANFNELLRTVHEAARNQNFMDSIADSMWNSTPGTDQTTRITPHYSFLSTPIGHETYIQSSTGQALRGPSFTGRFLQANRRNREITQRKISNRQLKNNVFRDQPRHQPGTTVLEVFQRRDPGSEAKSSSYDLVRQPTEPTLHRTKRSHTISTGTKKRLYPNLLLSDGMAPKDDDTNTDDDDESEKTNPQTKAGGRIMRMRKVSKKLLLTDQMETPTVTTATQFLRQNTVAHPYFQMIEALQEGYMMVFLIELTRLIATKERKAVRDVVKHTDKIVYGLYHSKQLLWLGKPLLQVTTNVAKLLKESEIDVIQNHAANLHRMLSQRHQELSVEVNTILEYADMLYEDDEGRLLLDALKEFADFPNIRLTGYWLCNSLVHNFLRPYRRLKDTQERQELIDSVNMKLESYKNTLLRNDDIRHSVGALAENQPSLQTEPVTQTEPHSDSTPSPRVRKRKRHHRSHKRERERKQRRIHRYRPQYIQRYYQKYNLRNVTARRRIQTRYRVKMQET